MSSFTNNKYLTNWVESNFSYSSKTGVKFLATNAATNVDVVISPKGTGGFTLQQPNGTATGGNNRGAYAVDLQLGRDLASSVASGSNSFAAGYGNTASSLMSIAFGDSNVSSGVFSTAFGSTNTSSATGSTAIGVNCTASADYSIAFGRSSAIGTIGGFARAAASFASSGDSQWQSIILQGSTTDATPEVLTADNAFAAATNCFVLQNNQSATYTAHVTAKKSGSTTSVAGWIIKGTAVRGASAATTVVGTPVVETLTNPDGWAITATADTTLGGIAFTFTGAAATNIRVTCAVDASTVIYT